MMKARKTELAYRNRSFDPPCVGCCYLLSTFIFEFAHFCQGGKRAHQANGSAHASKSE